MIVIFSGEFPFLLSAPISADFGLVLLQAGARR
jgi:hypothetical protein